MVSLSPNPAMSRLDEIFGGGINIRSFDSSLPVEEILMTSLPVDSSDKISKVTSVTARSSSSSSEILIWKLELLNRYYSEYSKE